MKKKNITIDDLARMVQKGFAETAKKEQVDNIEKRLERIEKKIEGVVYLRDFEKLESRVKVLEEALEIKA